MRWPIRQQILIPFAGVLVVAVATIAVTAAWLAARRIERENLNNLRSVAATLGQASFPYTRNVLSQMEGLSGARFLALDSDGRIVAATLKPSQQIQNLPPLTADIASLAHYPSVEVGGQQFLAARLRANGNAGVESLVVLYPEERWNQARWEAAWPSLAIGGLTILVMGVISAWLSNRLAARIGSVQELFARIAGGSFEHVNAAPPHDELHELVLSANRLSDQLSEMRQTIRQTERLRLVAQLAGGLAHQLRNAVTGARMAVQLHQKRCPSGAASESLDVALRQLGLTEEHVKRLLSIGRSERSVEIPGTVGDLVDEIEQLLLPMVRHARVRWTCECDVAVRACSVRDYDGMRSALLNVTLNAVEASGIEGIVGLRTERDGSVVRISVADSGSGPPADVQDSLFEPFVTSKPEGVGLGLALARRVAEAQGGTLSWSRCDAQTVFAFELPLIEVETRLDANDDPESALEPKHTSVPIAAETR